MQSLLRHLVNTSRMIVREHQLSRVSKGELRQRQRGEQLLWLVMWRISPYPGHLGHLRQCGGEAHDDTATSRTPPCSAPRGFIADRVDKLRFNRVCSQVLLSLCLGICTPIKCVCKVVSQRIPQVFLQPATSVNHIRHGAPQAHYQGDGTTHG